MEKRKANDCLDIYNSAEEIKEAFIKAPINNRKNIELPENNREALQELKFNKKVNIIELRKIICDLKSIFKFLILQLMFLLLHAIPSNI